MPGPSSIVHFPHFRLLLWNRLSGIQRQEKIWTSSTKFVFFWPKGKKRWPPWHLICWDIFDFSSETAERNLTKLDKKQDLNVLFQGCVFGPIRKTIRDGRFGLWLAETFSTSPLKPLNGIQRNLTGRKIPMSSTKCVFFGWSEIQDWRLVSDWLRHFRLLVWNCWTEFIETWQEARSQCPLPIFYFIFGPTRITRWPPLPPLGWDIFDFSSETADRNSTKFDRKWKQDINVIYQVYISLADRKNKMAA